MEWILGFIGIAVVIGFPWWLLYGATNNRMKDAEQELDEWSGVLDVKREIDNRLNDPDERKRVREKYQKTE